MKRKLISEPLFVHVAGVLAIAMIGIGGYIGCVSPAQAAQSRIGSLRASLAAASEEESSLRRRQREAEAKLRSARETLASRGVTLLPLEQLNATVDRVSRLAADCGVVIDSLSSAAPIEEPRFRRVPLRLAGRTTTKGVAEFMRAVRERFPDVTVRVFDMRSDVASQHASASVQMELDWYASKSDK